MVSLAKGFCFLALCDFSNLFNKKRFSSFKDPRFFSILRLMSFSKVILLSEHIQEFLNLNVAPIWAAPVLNIFGEKRRNFVCLRGGVPFMHMRKVYHCKSAFSKKTLTVASFFSSVQRGPLFVHYVHFCVFTIST